MNGEPAAAINESQHPRANELVEALTGPDDEPFTAGNLRPALRSHRAANQAIGTAGAQVTRGADEAASWEATEARIIRPVFPRPPPRSHLGVFLALQSWDGVVLEAGHDTFVARLVDKTGATADEEAEFRLDEIARSDLELVMPGAVFYWSVGYLDRPSGQRLRQSEIKFRRLPAWSDRELRDTRARAEELRDRLADQG